MEIYIWQAWSSNNSGSYTMVGSFEKAEDAKATAEVLQNIAIEHGAWVAASDLDFKGESPLARFCKTEGLNWKEGLGTWDDWPMYDDQDHPDIFVIDRQIFVCSDYTISLPTTFAEYIVRKGGRIATEIEHAHTPLVCTIDFFWEWKDKQRQEKKEAFVQKVKTEPTILSTETEVVPRYQLVEHGFLKVFVVFKDLVTGIKGLASLGIPYTVHVAEALSEKRPLQAYENVSEPFWNEDTRPRS